MNEMDNLYQKRFFPVGLNPHLKEKIGDWWYNSYLWYNNSMATLKCCSDTFASMNYVKPSEMYALEYFVYQVHPFGIQKNLTEKLPRKLSIEEIIAASDVKGYGNMYTDHTPVHNIEKSEYYKV